MSVTFAPGLTSLQGYLSDKNPNDTGTGSQNYIRYYLFRLNASFFEIPVFDPFIARGYGSPQWMGGFEALDGIFVYSIPANSETEEPPVSLFSCL